MQHGTKRKLVEGISKRDKFRILIMNVESFVTKKAPGFLNHLPYRSEFLLAVDESTTIKNIKAKRTKAIMKFGATAKYKNTDSTSDNTIAFGSVFTPCFSKFKTSWIR